MSACAQKSSEVEVRTQVKDDKDLFRRVLHLTAGGDLQNQKVVADIFGVELQIDDSPHNTHLGYKSSATYMKSVNDADLPYGIMYVKRDYQRSYNQPARFSTFNEVEMTLSFIQERLCMPWPVYISEYTTRKLQTVRSFPPAASYALYEEDGRRITITLLPNVTGDCVRSMILVQSRNR